MRARFAGVIAGLLLGAALARAQVPEGRVVVEPRTGAAQRASFPVRSFRIDHTEVERARCRSCTGRHTIYSVRVELPRGPVATVELYADVVGGRRSFSTGFGPYPAVSWVRVLPRGETEPVEVSGRIELADAPGGALVVRFVAGAPTSPVRRITFEVPPDRT